MSKVDTIQRLGREYNLVIAVSLLWFMIQFLRFIFPPLFDKFQVFYNVSTADVGILFSLLLAAYSIVQFPAGILGDKFGRPLIMLISVGVFTLSASLVAGSPGFVFLLGSVVLLGLGTGPHKAVAIPLLSNQYSDRTGRTLGVMDTIGQFGGVVAPLAVALFLSISIWQNIFLLSSVVSFLLGILLIMTIRRYEQLSFRSASKSGVVKQASNNRQYLSTFSDKRLIGFVFVAMIFTFAWNGFSAFFPLFLTTEKGMSASFASIQYSILFIASLSQTITGDLSDRVGRLRIGSMLFILISGSILLLLFFNHALIIGALSFMIGIGFHGFRPVRDSYLMDLIPDSVGGGTLGIVRTFMTGVGALAPATIGFISSSASFTMAYALISGTTTIGCVLMLFMLYTQR